MLTIGVIYWIFEAWFAWEPWISINFPMFSALILVPIGACDSIIIVCRCGWIRVAAEELVFYFSFTSFEIAAAASAIRRPANTSIALNYVVLRRHGVTVDLHSWRCAW